MICSLLAALLLAVPAPADEPLKFERIVIDDDFPGGYQVEVADVNGDKKPDIVALGGSTLAWYENPSWKKRVITKGNLPSDIISSATADLDGDGKAEIAVACDFAMNTPTRGKLLLAIQGATPDDKWTFKPIGDVPSIHRLRWGDLDGDYKPELVVAPIFGPKAKPPTYDQDPAQLIAFETGRDPKVGRWRIIPLAKLPVIHAIEIRAAREWTVGRATGLNASRGSVVFTADNTGVNSVLYDPTKLTPVSERNCIPGVRGTAPNRGSSEIHNGKLAGGHPFLATIDPWHGSEVAVCVADPTLKGLVYGHRTVLDNTLDDGHALWVADIDGDGNDEVFAGHRGKDARVSVYRFDGKKWDRTVLDPGLTAQDLRGGDIDGDGRPDVVAIGGKSHNVVWFRPLGGKGR
jgi:hypothetical protein